MGGKHADVGENGWFSLYLKDDLKHGESHQNTLTFEKYTGEHGLGSEEKFTVDFIEVLRS